VLAGFTAGLAGSVLAPAQMPSARVALLGGGALAVLALLRPWRGRVPAVSWLICLAPAAGLVGLALGGARLAAIDAGALDLPTGRHVAIRGFVTAAPSRAAGLVSVRVQTADGRLMLQAPEPVPELTPGTSVRAEGTIREPPAWQAAWFERLGIRDLLATSRIEVAAGRRSGVTGLLDGIRERAEQALARGTEPGAAELLRGFVLGEDDRIDEDVRDDFKRSGLAHLLAVSGQNVILLAVLAAAVLGALGVPLRTRLAWILVAIAVYVPVAGAGASIQRAGVMGAAGVIAALAGRPSSRWYALLVAAAATLALDPRASADIGWQLSFAAVVGILLAAAPIAAVAAGRRGGWRRALAEGVGLTVAATLATAPLMALHFGTFSVVTLPANLAALPAEAPVMWLGMLTAAAGQVPSLPVEPLTGIAGALAGYIAQVAHWFAAPAWAQADVGIQGIWALPVAYLAIGAGAAVALRALRRRRGLSAGRLRVTVLAATAALAVLIAGVMLGTEPPPGPGAGLRMTILDVGQGDSILLEPGDGLPVLVDTGTADADVASQLARRGIDRLGALVVTHPEADHDGGVPDVLDRIPTERLAFARVAAATRALARARGVDLVRVFAGSTLTSGSLRLEVLWPPRARLAAGQGGSADPNLLALVIAARWHRFDAMLAADAEAEAAPLQPGRLEVLKVAHHGSEDAGLADLLASARPRLALISVGEDNAYGHPAPATLATLAAARVPVLRTDLDGAVTVEVSEGGWVVR
jgi:competence protein ComEC